MPFVSSAQQRWMVKNKPAMAREWAAETKNMKSLPSKVKDARDTKKKGYDHDVIRKAIMKVEGRG